MRNDFDELIERRGTGCVKWDESPAPDIIPLWVADMDFRAAPAIQEAIRKRAEHGVFGYTVVGDDYYEAIIAWFERRHGWTIRREEILYTTGVVPAMSVAIKALTMPGERVLILSPDYNCFFSSIRNNGCEVLESVLRFCRNNNRFEVDWEDFEAKCADEKTTVFLLCNPHNPTGRVWTMYELQQMNNICLKYGVKVVSDEIHCELVMPGHRFQPFAAVSERCRQNCVTLNSPSKSFNTAGLQIANIICAQPEWRRRLDRAININEVCDVNPFGVVATIAAYNESEDWIEELNPYIWKNFETLKQMISLPITPLEGTYLAWVDCSSICQKLSMNSVILEETLMEKAKVYLNAGTMYGAAGEGFMRINLACPNAVLVEALNRLNRFIESL